jgi:hypothetical protein
VRPVRISITLLSITTTAGARHMAIALNLMARPLFFERFYREVEQLLRELSLEGRVKLAINEWGLDLPAERQYSMESALYGARLMNVFERMGQVVEMSAVSDLVNGWPGGIIQAGRHNVFVSPIYLVNQVYSENRGDVRLASSVAGPSFDTSREGAKVPCLDVVVSRSGDGRRMFIKAVNTSLTSSLVTTISVQGVSPGSHAVIKTISASSLSTANDFIRPDAVSISSKTLVGGRRFVVTLPKHSVSIIIAERTVGAALRGRPRVELIGSWKPRPRVRRTRFQRGGGHGGPPLQYVPRRPWFHNASRYSSMRMYLSTPGFAIVCTRPLGHLTSTDRTPRALPNPTTMRGSFDER